MSTSMMEAAVEKALATRKKSKVPRHITIEQRGTKIVLPEGLDIPEAINALRKRLEADEQVVEVNADIPCDPVDGVVSMMRVLKERFSWVDLESRTIQSFFGRETAPPQMFDVAIGPHETMSVPWGPIKLPGLPGQIETRLHQRGGFFDRETIGFRIYYKCRAKHKAGYEEIVNLVRQDVARNSIYTGQALSVNFDAENDFGYAPTVEFMDVAGFSKSDVIFRGTVERQVSANLWTPITLAREAQGIGVDPRRAVLLHGHYGTGKTLVARITANLCVESKRTFIYIKDPKRLEDAINFAAQYQPAMIFMEDIDRVFDDDVPEHIGRSLLNAIDGVNTKRLDIMITLTTNHVAKIGRGMMRPGRLDAVIEMQRPDADAAIRLIRHYAGPSLKATDAALAPVGDRLANHIPAIISECVARSKLVALDRLGSSDDLNVSADDLLVTADQLAGQVALLEGDSEGRHDVFQRAAQEFGRGIIRGVAEGAGRPAIAASIDAEDTEEL